MGNGGSRREGAAPLSQEQMEQMPPCVVLAGSQSRKATSLLPKQWCCCHGKGKSLMEES